MNCANNIMNWWDWLFASIIILPLLVFVIAMMQPKSPRKFAAPPKPKDK